MRGLATLAIVLVSLLFAGTEARPDGRIWGGEPAVEGQFPWMVSVFYTTSTTTSICGGALVSDQWVVTAAHCLQGVNNLTLYLGSTSLTVSDPHRVVRLSSEYVIHPEYNQATFDNDIGLVKLFTRIQAYNDWIQRIPVDPTYLVTGVTAAVSGWGVTNNDVTDVNPDLHYYELSTITNKECNLYWPDWVNYRMVCGLGLNQNICNGDSGGPLVTYKDGRPFLTGVASFNSGSCVSAYPSGFIRTSIYKFWIEDTIGASTDPDV